MANTTKKKKVQDFINFLQTGTNFFLVDFKKVNHQTLEDLRRQLKKNNARLLVVKNKLFQKAINKLSQTEKKIREFSQKSFPLRGKTALIVTQKDGWEQPLKVVAAAIEKTKAVQFKQGIIEEDIYDQEKLLFLSQLPNKETLIAKVISQLKSPITSLVRSLKYNQTHFVLVLKKGGEKSK